MTRSVLYLPVGMLETLELRGSHEVRKSELPRCAEHLSLERVQRSYFVQTHSRFMFSVQVNTDRRDLWMNLMS